jgi:hypothetical protein
MQAQVHKKGIQLVFPNLAFPSSSKHNLPPLSFWPKIGAGNVRMQEIWANFPEKNFADSAHFIRCPRN